MTIELQPVGCIRNAAREASWGKCYQSLSWTERAARMQAQRDAVSEVVVNDDLDGILEGIEEYSHLTIIYWAHQIPEERRQVRQVHPLGSPDFPLVGTFATHSPARPNSILVTVVRLLERHGNVLRVTGLDALDGSPVLDIKPYSADPELAETRIPDWLRRMHDAFRTAGQADAGG